MSTHDKSWLRVSHKQNPQNRPGSYWSRPWTAHTRTRDFHGVMIRPRPLDQWNLSCNIIKQSTTHHRWKIRVEKFRVRSDQSIQTGQTHKGLTHGLVRLLLATPLTLGFRSPGACSFSFSFSLSLSLCLVSIFSIPQTTLTRINQRNTKDRFLFLFSLKILLWVLSGFSGYIFDRQE